MPLGSWNILWSLLHSNRLHSCRDLIVNWSLALNHLRLWMLLSLSWNHHWCLNKLNLRLSWLSIHPHVLRRIHWLHLERLSLLIKVHWHRNSKLSGLLCCLSSIRSLIHNFNSLLRLANTLLVLWSQDLRWMCYNRWARLHNCLTRLYQLSFHLISLLISSNIWSSNINWWILNIRIVSLRISLLKFLLLVILFHICFYWARLLENYANWLIGLLLNPTMLLWHYLLYVLWLLTFWMSRNRLWWNTHLNILRLVLTIHHKVLSFVLIKILELLWTCWNSNYLAPMILLLKDFISLSLCIILTCLQKTLTNLLINSVCLITSSIPWINITIELIFKQELLPWNQSTSQTLLLSLNF